MSSSLEKHNFLLSLLAKEKEHTKTEIKKPKQPSVGGKSDFLQHYSDVYFKKYNVLPTIQKKKDVPLARKIVEKFGGDLKRAKQLVQHYIENYESFDFVNIARYPRPLVGGFFTFAEKVMISFDEKAPPPDLYGTPAKEKKVGFNFD